MCHVATSTRVGGIQMCHVATSTRVRGTGAGSWVKRGVPGFQQCRHVGCWHHSGTEFPRPVSAPSSLLKIVICHPTHLPWPTSILSHQWIFFPSFSDYCKHKTLFFIKFTLSLNWSSLLPQSKSPAHTCRTRHPWHHSSWGIPENSTHQQCQGDSLLHPELVPNCFCYTQSYNVTNNGGLFISRSSVGSQNTASTYLADSHVLII